MENWQRAGFGVYIHWPYCQSKCPYCDFNSHVTQKVDVAEWQKAYLQEIENYRAQTPNRVVHSLYFGGGTPSLMEPSLVAAIIDKIVAVWKVANDIEITLEANPGSVEARRFAGYRDAGVNRVSVGVQALNDIDLRRLGRIHTRKDALQALDIAKSTFDRVNFDLIYARQDQTLNQWQDELAEALSFAADHLSLYQLTIEEGTVFSDRFARGLLKGLPSDDLGADMYELTQDLCNAASLPAYEVSNHAAPGSESRHNHIYWRSGDYVGIGPGAHGRLTLGDTRLATEAHRAPIRWLEAVSEFGSGEAARTKLSARDQTLEYLLMSLRINEGLNTDRLVGMSGVPLPKDTLAELVSLGLLERSDSFVRTTSAGRMILNGILEKLAQNL